MTKIVLTYDDFVALPDDGNRYELHEGELSVTPSPGRRHQTILGRLYRILGAHVDEAPRALPPFPDLRLDPGAIWP
jgi:Uma2 family endonuclease